MAVEGSVPGMGQIVPHLVVRDTEEAFAFYQRAFGAKVLYRSSSPTGAGEHVHLKIWETLIQGSTEEPGQRQRRIEGALLASPDTLAGSTCVFQVRVAHMLAVDRRKTDFIATARFTSTAAA